MANKDYYPEGAANDPRAPYNQHDAELSVEVTDIYKDESDGMAEVCVQWYADGECWFHHDEYSVYDLFPDLSSSYEFTLDEIEGKTDDEIEYLIYQKEGMI